MKHQRGRLRRWAEGFFKWYCHPEYFEDIQGDLNELHNRHKSTKVADRMLALEVVLLFRPGIIRPIGTINLNHSVDMIRNYFTIAFRNLRKHPFFTVIHIIGLAIGLTAFLYLQQYNSFEKSYDTFHESPGQLYRLTTDDVKDGQIQVRDAMSFAPSGKALMEDIPEVISYTTTYKTWRMIFRKDGQPVEETGVIAVDSSFLNLFAYPILRGDKATMLTEPNSIVLTESQSRKYFDNADPIGQSIHVLGSLNRPFQVTGVLEDTPQNTHYPFNTLISLASLQERVDNDAWGGYNYYTYLKLSEQARIDDVRALLPDLSRKYLGDETRLRFHLQPVTDIHLYSDFTFEPETHGSRKAVGFLNIISIFILLIAWVNYINLSTARSIERAKEVSLRKVVGAQRRELITQFLMESVLINFMGALLALALAQLCLPYFHDLVGKKVITGVFEQPAFLTNLGLFFLVGTVVTGFYPALILSSFKPVQVLRGAFGRSRKGAWTRKALVTSQFVASMILIASTVIIYQQIRFMTNQDIGIDTEQVVGFDTPDSPEIDRDQQISKYKAFLNELTRTQHIEKAAGISNMPGGGSADISSNSGGVTIVGMTDRKETTVYLNSMNDQLLSALDIDIIAGRNFNHELAEDTSAIMVNHSLLDMMEIPDPQNVLNAKLQFGRNPDNDKFTIVGVIDDYNRSSLKYQVEPTVFFHSEITSQTVAKLKAADMTAGLRSIESVWSEFYPNAPFDVIFLDERFEKLYTEDKRFGMIFLCFAVLAILVASMGLFGLASYLSLQRTKEVGIRKVLGATVSNIVLLFFKDFLWLILLAVLIGIPLVYISMTNWLEGFAYRLDFPWWTIGLAVAVIIAIAFVTVSFQTWKLAMLNPARTMRDE